jgi:maleylpyruvate isomerase
VTGAGAPSTLTWWAEGERHLGRALGRLTDEEFSEPSLLPGWSRATLLAHLARNADALVNLLTWARTGVETPMYASREVRGAEIAETAGLPAGALRAEVLDAAGRLATAVRQLPDAAWSVPVRTAQGREVAATEVPWMRCREVWVHAVDLDAGVDLADCPDDILAALVDDVFTLWRRRDQDPGITVVAGDRTWGSGATTVSGCLAALAGWLTGRSDGASLRSDGPRPNLPRWL